MSNSIELVKPFTRVFGSINGLQQSSLQITFRLTVDEACSFSVLDEYVEEFLAEQLPVADLADLSLAQTLIYRVLFWTGAFQRMCRLPVSDTFYIAPMAPHFQKNEGLEEKTAQLNIQASMPFTNPQAATLTLARMVKLVELFFNNELPVGQDPFEQLQEALHKFVPDGINAFHIIQAAQKLNYQVIAAPALGLQIGTGCHSHILQSSITDKTSFLGVVASQDKAKTAQVMRRAGLPAPRHKMVTNAEAAVNAAEEIGYPVVIKPADLDQGQGVCMFVQNRVEVFEEFKKVRKLSRKILVEQQYPGDGYRLTVFRGQIHSCIRRIAGGVTGDGRQTVEQLVEVSQEDIELRRRRDSIGKLTLDDEARVMLKRQKMTEKSIPEEGYYVRLRRRDNLSAGGTVERIDLEDIHPDNMLLAQRAASALWLDWVGVDLLSPDITKSWLDTGAVICEVNSRPQWGPGKDKKNFIRILQQITGNVAHVPVGLFIAAKDDVVSLRTAIEKKLAASETYNTISSIDGMWVNGRKYAAAQSNSFFAARIALTCRDTKGLVAIMSPEEVVQYGLPADNFQKITLVSAENWDDNGDMAKMIRGLVQHNTEQVEG